MKFILPILLLFTSCSSFLDRPPKKDCEKDFNFELERCMMRFSQQGFDSEAIVRICGKVYERRQ